MAGCSVKAQGQLYRLILLGLLNEGG